MIEDTSSAKIDCANVSNDIKKGAEKIEVADAELIANAPDISPDDAETIKHVYLLSIWLYSTIIYGRYSTMQYKFRKTIQQS